RQNRINLFSSYKQKQYQIHTCFNVNRVKAQENGGIDSLHYLGSSEYSNRKNIPVRIDDASSQVFNTSFYLVQEYQIGKSFEEVRAVSSEAINKVGSKPLSGKGIKIVKDTSNISGENVISDTLSIGMREKTSSMSDSLMVSVTTDTVKVFKMSGLSISHEMIYNSNVRKFFDDNITEDFYSGLDIFIDSVKSRDATGQKQFGNKFSLHYKYLEKFSSKVSFFNEYEIYEFSDTIHEINSTGLQDTVIRSGNSETTTNNSVNLYLRARLFDRYSFKGMGEYFISGYKQGNSLANLEVSWLLFKNTEISLSGRYENFRPDYYYQNYTSNNFIWHNQNLRRIEKWNSEFLIRNRKFNTIAKIRYGQILNYLYIDQTAYVNQYYGQINIISAELSEKIKLGPVHSLTRLVYQKSSNDSILSLPDINLYQSLYYEHLKKFKSTGGELLWQFGVDYRYSGGYFADGYMPVSGLFYRQYDHRLSDFHCMDIFINLMIKRARFYLKYNYLNSAISENYFFTGPYYPSPQPVFKFGLAWTFYD
ncbi:MAG: putative porin, partial [Bacteroidales bacterium]|nr:putative porin [Bacteroidales bacterium]